MWTSQEPHRVRSTFIRIWNSHIYLYCVIFKLKLFKNVFSAPFLKTHVPNNLHSITYYENNVQNPIRTYPIIALQEHYKALFHVLESYSTNQIPLCHIWLCSITCHFLGNNLHFISYSNCIIQHHRKKICLKLYATDSEFSTHSPVFWLKNSLLATLELTQLCVNSL